MHLASPGLAGTFTWLGWRGTREATLSFLSAVRRANYDITLNCRRLHKHRWMPRRQAVTNLWKCFPRDSFDDLEDFHGGQRAPPQWKLKVTSCQHCKVMIIRVTSRHDVSFASLAIEVEHSRTRTNICTSNEFPCSVAPCGINLWIKRRKKEREKQEDQFFVQNLLILWKILSHEKEMIEKTSTFLLNES